MGYGSPDIYSQPEAFGLTIVGKLNDKNLSYEFNMLLVFEHADGRVFYARDSGCSCPSPFERFTSLNDATLVTPETWGEFVNKVLDFPTNAADKTQLLAKVSPLVPHARPTIP